MAQWQGLVSNEHQSLLFLPGRGHDAIRRRMPMLYQLMSMSVLQGF